MNNLDECIVKDSACSGCFVVCFICLCAGSTSFRQFFDFVRGNPFLHCESKNVASWTPMLPFGTQLAS